ncbi:MAG: calcium-binding protein [Pseudomonadota bacterium]
MAVFTSSVRLNVTNDTTLLELTGNPRVTTDTPTLNVTQFNNGSVTIRGSALQDLGGVVSELIVTFAGVGSVSYTGLSVSLLDVATVSTFNPAGLSELLLEGNDQLTGSGFDDVLNGFTGDDEIFGGNGDDQISGNIGRDDLNGGSGNDDLFGSTGDDKMSGGSGNDALFGGTENDDMSGGTGNDDLFGGIGDDTLNGGAGADLIDGGNGIDIVSYVGSLIRNVIDLQGLQTSVGDAAGDVLRNIEQVVGGDRIDLIYGDSAANSLSGGLGNDRLYGRAGDDTLEGSNGIDKLYGNAGADIMTGGEDRDRFIYFKLTDSRAGENTRDTITDFDTSEDRIELGRIDADTTRGGNQAFEFIRFTAFSGEAGELRFSRIDGDTILMGDTDGDRQADFEIELTGLVNLMADDFIL